MRGCQPEQRKSVDTSKKRRRSGPEGNLCMYTMTTTTRTMFSARELIIYCYFLKIITLRRRVLIIGTPDRPRRTWNEIIIFFFFFLSISSTEQTHNTIFSLTKKNPNTINFLPTNVKNYYEIFTILIVVEGGGKNSKLNARHCSCTVPLPGVLIRFLCVIF